MHVGKLLARLNPTTIRYDVGRGGKQELTPQDIAAAVAMVPPGLGRELMCLVWWPDGAKQTAAQLEQALMEAQLQEWRARADALLDAQLVEAYAQKLPERIKARDGMDAAKAAMWPRLGPDGCYGAIRKAVLCEVGAALRCMVCDGDRVIPGDGEAVTCDACSGTGRGKVSDRGRADAISRDTKTYRETWAKVYEWTITRCYAELDRAEGRLKRAVS